MRYFEESVAHPATTDVDNCSHRPRIGQSVAEYGTSRTQQRHLRASGDLMTLTTIGARTARGTRPWSFQKQTPKTAAGVPEAHPQEPRNGSGVVAGGAVVGADNGLSRHQMHLERFLQWADDEGRELREDDAVDSALVEFLSHRFLLGLQA